MKYQAKHYLASRLAGEPSARRRRTRVQTGIQSILALSLACCCFTSYADAADANAEPMFEASALFGYRSGGDFDELQGTDNPNIQPDPSYGASLGWYADSQTKYELIYDLQQTNIQDTSVDLDVEHLHLGGTAAFGGGDVVQPYIAGGLGATRFRPSVGENETRFSVSMGFGIEIPIGQRIGLRLEARGYLVNMSSDSALFCESGASGGTCLVRAAGSTLFQYGVLGGIGVKF
jgi:Outer membrane protein beta-barrel domain